jgi:hypothetical protein
VRSLDRPGAAALERFLQHLAWFLVPYDTGMMLVHKISNPDPALTETWLYIFPRQARQNYLTMDIPNSCTYSVQSRR